MEGFKEGKTLSLIEVGDNNTFIAMEKITKVFPDCVLGFVFFISFH